MAGTNASTKENNKLYNSTVQAISRVGGDYTTKVGVLCDSYVDMESPVKTQVEIGLSKHLNLRGQTIDVSEQAVFILKYLGLHDEGGKKTNISDLLTVCQRWSGRFCLS